MGELVYYGEVSLRDAYRVSYIAEMDPDPDDWEDQSAQLNGSIWVGDRDVVKEVSEEHWNGTVIVALGDERFLGSVDVELGWGYSEYTAMDPDKLTVGDHDLVEIVSRHDGQTIFLSISDEAINVFEVREKLAIEEPKP